MYKDRSSGVGGVVTSTGVFVPPLDLTQVGPATGMTVVGEAGDKTDAAAEFLKALQHSQRASARLEECVSDSWQTHVLEHLNSARRNARYQTNFQIPE